MNRIKDGHILLLPVLILLFAFMLNSIPVLQFADAINNWLHFHFQGIGAAGNSVIIRTTGAHGEYQQWRWWLAPIIGNEMSRQIDTNFGFKNGEMVTTCVTDVGNGKPVSESCDSANLNFNSGTDFYLTIPSR